MGLDRTQTATAVTTTANLTPTLGLTREGYLSSWTMRETAGASGTLVKIRDSLPRAIAITSAADGAAGNSTTGLHMFMVAFVTVHGETFRGALLEFTTAGSKIINLTGVPTCQTTDSTVIGRRIYETKAGAPATGVSPTTAQWFRIVADSSATLAAGMNNLYLPQASITVNSTTGFTATNGVIAVTTANGIEPVNYTSVDATHFLGCTGGSGLMATGGAVTQPMIGDNTTTTYAANVVDGSLTATNPTTVDQSGKVIEPVSLAANQSVGTEYGNPVRGSNGGGFYCEVVSGTVDWCLRGA